MAKTRDVSSSLYPKGAELQYFELAADSVKQIYVMYNREFKQLVVLC